ncbi:MAG: hypothetical protein MK110_16245 [Fuerstiella sp.]|nr:hypothetical protein [Fuerstiella sp.]
MNKWFYFEMTIRSVWSIVSLVLMVMIAVCSGWASYEVSDGMGYAIFCLGLGILWVLPAAGKKLWRYLRSNFLQYPDDQN